MPEPLKTFPREVLAIRDFEYELDQVRMRVDHDIALGHKWEIIWRDREIVIRLD